MIIEFNLEKSKYERQTDQTIISLKRVILACIREM
jgi:hypothetical protein